jgi:hypothetical protein
MKEFFPEKFVIFTVLSLIALLSVLTSCSDSVLRELNKNLQDKGLKECRIFDDELNKYEWKMGNGILCRDISDCDENKYPDLKNNKVDCLPTKYIYEGSKCKDGEIYDSKLPDNAAVCRNGKLYMLEGVYNQYVVLAEEMSKLMLSKDSIETLRDYAEEVASEKAKQNIKRRLGKRICYFGKESCDYSGIDNKNFKVKLKNYDYPIKIMKYPFNVDICANASLNMVNGQDEFPLAVMANEEFEIDVSCPAPFDAARRMAIGLPFEATETGLRKVGYIIVD